MANSVCSNSYHIVDISVFSSVLCWKYYRPDTGLPTLNYHHQESQPDNKGERFWGILKTCFKSPSESNFYASKLVLFNK